MSPTRSARISRAVSWIFMLIATAAIVVGYIRLDNNQAALQDTNHRLCQAVLLLTTPTSEQGISDPLALSRIRTTNRIKHDARDKLLVTFACDDGPQSLEYLG